MSKKKKKTNQIELPTYSDRVWLNPDDSPSTGSAVAYDGPSQWGDGRRITFLEIGSCHEVVRLHQCDSDTTEDMIRKMEKLSDVIDQFIVHLKSVSK